MLEDSTAGEFPRHGSLVGYIIANYKESAGRVESESAITSQEIIVLRKWFESGVPDKRMDGACETGKGVKDAHGVWSL